MLKGDIKMRISLIQTSQNRRNELHRFIKSLNAQIGIDFKQVQLIFVDQENNLEVFDEIDKRIEFQYIKYKHCSLSHARNIGLKYVKGDYVGFPDDDCRYEPNALYKIINSLKTGFDGVVAKGTDEQGKLTNVFPNKQRVLDKFNRCGAISYTIFVRFDRSVFFDENLGVGSPHGLGAGEETDYILRLMEENDFKILYNPEITVHHPSFAPIINQQTLAKIKSYSCGNGYLMYKHNFPIGYVLKQIVRPMLGFTVYWMCGKTNRAQHSFNIFTGRLKGYLFGLRKQI